MKYLYLSIFLLTLSCGGVKKDPKAKEDLKETATMEVKEIILELKNPNTINDAKSLIKNSGLTWDKMVFENEANAIALIKVPTDKVGFWKDRLTKSNEFKSVSAYDKNTLETLVKNAKSSFLTFRKTECLGDCAVYNVSIDALGNGIYTGIKHVTVTGKKEFKLTNKELTTLNEKLAKNNFSEYKQLYDNPKIMDLPSTFISFKGKQVQIRLWKGIPENLVDVHEYVEGILLDKKFFE